MNDLQIPLFCVHTNQCDRKKCTALKLAHQNLLQIKPKLNFCPRKAIILDPFAEKVLCKDDAQIMEKFGIIVIDCSWEHAETIFQRPYQTGRKLPQLLAANSVNYGRWMRLSSAEALAASLVIIGHEMQAQKLLEIFSWGPAFFGINAQNFENLEKIVKTFIS